MKRAWASLILLVACARGPVHAPTQWPSAGALYASGLELAAGGDLLRAEQYFAGALRAGHDPAQSTRALVSVCVRGGRLRSAMLYASTYLTAHPGDVALRRLLASLYWSLGDRERAEQELRLVLALAPRDEAGHYLLMLVLDGAPEARDHAARYLELAPEGVHAEEVRAVLRQTAEKS